MNVEFKQHQLVVAGMQTQIKLLTQRCIEWQAKLAEQTKAADAYLSGCIAAANQITAIDGILMNPGCPCANEWGSDAIPAKVARHLLAKNNILSGYEQRIDTLEQAAASQAENFGTRLKEALKRSRARTKSRR